MKVKDVSGCTNCPLRDKLPERAFVPVEWGSGFRLQVGEAAGADEEIIGKPFVGGAGRIRDQLLRKANINKAELTTVNTLSCRPPLNVYPDASEARSYCTKEEAETVKAHCYKNHLEPVLKARKWERIDCLGDKALNAVTGLSGINRWRGSIVASKVEPTKTNVVATLHPAYIARDWSMAPIVVSDLKKTLVLPPQHYNLYPSLQEVQQFTATSFALDIETDWNSSNITMVGLCDKPYYAIVVPFKGPYIAEIKRIVTNATEIVTQNGIAFDMPVLERNGVFASASCDVHDLMLGHALVCPDLEHNLGFIVSQFTNVPAWKHTAASDKERYNAIDTDGTLQAWLQVKALLKQFGLWNTYSNVSIPAAMVCREMKRVGVKLDHRKVGVVRERIEAEQVGLEAQLPVVLRSANVPVNKRVSAVPGTLGKSGKPVKYVLVPSSELVVPWRSDVTVGKWLYGAKADGDLQLPVQKHIKTGKKTTDKIALAKLAKIAGVHAEGIRAVMRLRSLDELLTTFAKEEFKYTDVLHPNFNAHGTSQGRLSSSEPNMQNFPEEARCIIIPHYPDWRIMSFDFSQLENRLTATLANDTERIQRFNTIPDYSEHKWAASVIFDIPYAKIVKDNSKDAEYGKGKRIMHGTSYRMGARKIATMYDLVEREVKQQQAKLLARMPKTIDWQDAVAAEAKSKGFLTNAFGRKRWFGTPSYFAEAASFHGQSCGADIVLRVMIGLLYQRIHWPIERAMAVCPVVRPIPKQSDLLIQVHDNLTFQYHPSVEQELYDAIVAVATQIWRELAGFSCPIAVETGLDFGPEEKYGTLKKFTPKEPHAN